MQGRGSGRFGKYGDLKRKDKIRQNRLNQHEKVSSLRVSEKPRMPNQPGTGGKQK